MDLAGRHGGDCRPPRVPLLPEQFDTIKADTLRVLPLEDQARERKQG